MNGFEIFDISSWLDSDGLVLKAKARVRALGVKGAARKLGRSLVAGTLLSLGGFGSASASIQLELPFVVQVASSPRAEELLVAPAIDLADAATSAYWAALMTDVSSWALLEETSAISPEPLD
jgi:hypothetical protein